MILVTGATGRVGAEVVRELLARGAAVRALCREAQGAWEKLGAEVGLVVGDLDRPESIRAALDGVDRVFLLTASSEHQLDQERSVIEAARQAGVRHVVKLSVLGADDQSPVQMARWHRQGERELEQSALAYTLLRPSFFMQNFLGMIDTTSGAIYTAAEDGKVGMVDARDIAAVAAVALTEDGHEGKTYVITGPEALSFDAAAATFSSALGKEIRHVRVPPEAVKQAMLDRGPPVWYAEAVAALQGVFAAGYAATTTDTVTEVTGREPRTLAKFAAEHAAVFAAAAG